MSLHGEIHLILKITTNIPDKAKTFAAGAEIYAPDKMEFNHPYSMDIKKDSFPHVLPRGSCTRHVTATWTACIQLETSRSFYLHSYWMDCHELHVTLLRLK